MGYMWDNVEFYRAEEERAKMEKDGEICLKIVSTLRHANSLGLRAEVICMSGGGLGQTSPATMDDPGAKNNTILIARTNDVKNTEYATEEEYAQSVKTSLNKLSEMVVNQPNDNFVLVTATPTTNDYMIESEKESVRRQYLNKAIEDLVESNPVGNLKSQGIKYEIGGTGHPSVDGTKEILEQLWNCTENVPELVWMEKFSTSERPYSGVQGIFKYGCNHCGACGVNISITKYTKTRICVIIATKEIRNSPSATVTQYYGIQLGRKKQPRRRDSSKKRDR